MSKIDAKLYLEHLMSEHVPIFSPSAATVLQTIVRHPVALAPFGYRRIKYLSYKRLYFPTPRPKTRENTSDWLERN